ncbi:MAG: sigma-70 family RNA polymerase sigma factor [Spirochaetes bacterium]|nr:sigma-70 family RNA polymerase sigma factor [Spirochaetota bacterium]
MNSKTPQQLLTQYLDFIRRTIIKIKIVNNIPLAEEDINEIFQDICEKLLDKGFANYKGISKLETYLYRIIYNEITNYIEKKHKIINASQIGLNDPQDDDNEDNYSKFFDHYSYVSIDFTNPLVLNDILSIIDQTISTFDDRDKLIFQWYFLCNKTQTQVARMVKLSQPTVCERIEKIKKQIITAIKKKYPEVEEELLS